jgi:hypothetical protein
VTVFGQDSFTVVPGVEDNQANWDESIKQRVIELLTEKTETGDQLNESDAECDAPPGVASSSPCTAETGCGRGSGCGGTDGDHADGACNQNSEKSGEKRSLSVTARLLGGACHYPRQMLFHQHRMVILSL